MDKQNTRTSKFLSYVLRHQPESIGLTLDNEGWAEFDRLLICANRAGTPLTRQQIEAVVASNDKKRFTISDDGLRIRAAQGHSTPSVSMTYTEKQPPEQLFHGTATRFLDAIKEKGLIPGSRHHVHLSSDKQTASAVGQRYGKPVVLSVNTQLMHERGFLFYQADNGVWLTEHVPAEFLIFDEP